MTCIDMRDLMLSADPGELRGSGDSFVAAHIRECAECAAMAALLRARCTSLSVHLRVRRNVARKRSTAVALVAAGMIAALWMGTRTRSLEFAAAPDPEHTGLEVTPTDGSYALISKTNSPDVVLVRLIPRNQ